jgi:hypothetical protein
MPTHPMLVGASQPLTNAHLCLYCCRATSPLAPPPPGVPPAGKCSGKPSIEPADGSFTWPNCADLPAGQQCTAECGEGYEATAVGPPTATCGINGWTVAATGACRPGE